MAIEKIYLGGGCFWCIEAVYSKTKGILTALSGYAGGRRPHPTYEQVCTGVSGHAEVVEVTYDSEVITTEEILEIFFAIHNPTTLNAQGADVGSQYRSVIFYTTQEQKITAQKVFKEVQTKLRDPIVTELQKAPTFYEAEAYHQHYFENNPNQGYCSVVIKPKVEKFIHNFPTKLKK